VEFRQGVSEATVVSAQFLLDARTRVLGIAHRDTLSSMSDLAMALYELGRRQSAIELMVQCAALSSESLRPSHPLSVERIAEAREWEAEDAREEYGSSVESSRSGSVTSEEERKAEGSDEDDFQEGSAAELKGTDEEPLERSDSHVM
jgi:hypothetical protein